MFGRPTHAALFLTPKSVTSLLSSAGSMYVITLYHPIGQTVHPFEAIERSSTPLFEVAQVYLRNYSCRK